MWKWRSWGNRKADTSGLISSFSPCRLDQRKEKYSFARHFSNCQKCFLSLSKILLGRAILRVIKVIKTEKYCNFSCCPQKYFPYSRKYFSNIPLNPDPRRWRYSPVRHKMFAVTTNASISQRIAMQTVLHNTLDENHSSIRFELAKCGSRILAMSFFSVRLAHIVASSIFSSAIM